MAIKDLHMHPDALADLIHKGIAANFEEMIKARLQAQIDPIISQMAREIADQIAVKVHAMNSPDLQTFSERTVVHLAFNSKDIVYTAEEPKPGVR